MKQPTKREKKCPDCNGEGLVLLGEEDIKCILCEGTGKIKQESSGERNCRRKSCVDEDKMCNVKHPVKGTKMGEWSCCLRKGHKGEHHAHGGTDWNGKEDCVFTWKDTPLNPKPASGLENPYPEDIFREPKDWKKISKLLQDNGYSSDAIFGSFGRRVWDNCSEKAMIILLEQEKQHKEWYASQKKIAKDLIDGVQLVGVDKGEITLKIRDAMADKTMIKMLQDQLKEQEAEIKELRHAIVDDDSITDHKEILEFAEDLRDAYDKVCKLSEAEGYVIKFPNKELNHGCHPTDRNI